jgi:uncharacterized tellurite resistance protein B-like protein
MIGRPMIGDLLELFGGAKATRSPAGREDEPLRIAAAALLVDAAAVDDQFDAVERVAIERVLASRFGLAAEEARRLLAEGRRRRDASPQLFGFTRTVNERLPIEERVELIEMLWEVVLADGELDPLEDTLLRRVGGLLDVPDRERGLARRRVLERLGRTDRAAET